MSLSTFSTLLCHGKRIPFGHLLFASAHVYENLISNEQVTEVLKDFHVIVDVSFKIISLKEKQPSSLRIGKESAS